jgi:endonuclease/exonuclease/phosphatase family metal-dependent hydrolase
MKTPLFVLLLVVVLLPTHADSKQETTPVGRDRVVTVMTQNVYHGVDEELNAVAGAVDFPDLLAKVAAVYQGYLARDFPSRAEAIADQVELVQPELIALQEAILVRTQTPPDGPATPATTVALDYVQLLLDALADRGLHYEVVVQLPNFDVELPSALGIDVRQTDRSVILARADLKTSELKLSNAQAGNFATNCVLPTSIGDINFLRGWAAVDVKIRGKSFRFISTHLDFACLQFTSAIQLAQAAELMNGPAATSLPVVLAGDFNSPADGTGATYNTLTAAGFRDAGAEAGIGHLLTCCQAPDLLNLPSLLDMRVDLVLLRGGFGVRAADVFGDHPDDRTPSGLWPSDHAGVAATLVLPHP